MIPTVSTERLALRAPILTDFEPFADFLGSDRASFLGGPYPRHSAWQSFCALAGTWQVLGFGRWMVTVAGDDTPVGVVGLLYPYGWPEPEIGWSMFAAGEGKGYAFEAARAARTYAYETLGWTTAISLIDPANDRSVALGRRLGCHEEGLFEHEVHGAMHVWRHPGPEVAA